MNGKNIMNHKGEQGGRILSAGESFSMAVDGKFATGFTCISDTTITTIASNYVDADTKLAGAEVLAGSFVAGIITELTITSGLVAVHYGEE